MPDRYAIGKIVGVFGIKGLLKVHCYSPDPARLRRLQTVLAGNSPDTANMLTVEDVLFHAGGIRMKFLSINDRTAAEALVGKYLFVERAEALPPAPGFYYVHDIIGCEVRDESDAPLGVVVDVLKSPGQDIWVIGRTDETIFQLPAVKEFIVAVDLVAGRITVRVIEGLIDSGNAGRDDEI